MNFDVGEQIGGYVLLASCGRGACGEVFLARNVITGRVFALKVLAPGIADDRELEGVVRYQAAAAHTSLMQIHHAGREAGRFFYVMDAADDLGGNDGAYWPDTLQNRLTRRGRIPAAELRPIAASLAEDLTLLHQKGLFHRDIKPGNVLFFNGRATLGDIGLTSDKPSGTLIGTAGFLSPAVLTGARPFAAADDFHALGRTIYCALTGNAPEKFPAFPAELDLKPAREIVALYNAWCAGKCEVHSPPVPARRRLWPYVLTAALLAALLAAAVFLSPTPLFRSAEMAPLNARAYFTELERLSETFPLPENFSRLLPQIRQQQERWWRERDAAGRLAFDAPVTAEEVAEMATRPGKTDHPEFYLRSDRQDAATAAFDAAHRDDAVWQYLDVDAKIGAEIARMLALREVPQLQSHDFGGELPKMRELFRRRVELAAQIAAAFPLSAE